MSDDSDYFYEHIQETLDAVGLGKIKAKDVIDIVEGYKGQGYGISVQEELGKLTHLVSFSLSVYVHTKCRISLPNPLVLAESRKQSDTLDEISQAKV